VIVTVHAGATVGTALLVSIATAWDAWIRKATLMIAKRLPHCIGLATVVVPIANLNG
jgi:hypothetical protein